MLIYRYRVCSWMMDSWLDDNTSSIPAEVCVVWLTVTKISELTYSRYEVEIQIWTGLKLDPLKWIWYGYERDRSLDPTSKHKSQTTVFFIFGIRSFHCATETAPTATSHFCLLTRCVSQMSLSTWICMSLRNTQRCVLVFSYSDEAGGGGVLVAECQNPSARSWPRILSTDLISKEWKEWMSPLLPRARRPQE